MSYSIGLYRWPRKTPMPVSRHQEGGTIAVGGSTTAEMDVTYNYAPYFYEYLDREEGLRWLYGKRAGECQSRLREAIDRLKLFLAPEPPADYWEAHPDNARHALAVLLDWAGQHPGAVFEGD